MIFTYPKIPTFKNIGNIFKEKRRENQLDVSGHGVESDF